VNGPVIPGIDGGKVTSLTDLAIHLDALPPNRRPGITVGLAFQASAWKVAEEAGELAGAHSRWRGTSRCLGSLREVAAEVADMVLAAAVYAVQAGVRLVVIDQALVYELLGLRRAIPSADAALNDLTVAVGHFTEAHANDAGERVIGAYVTMVITVARDYAACAGISLDAPIIAKAQAILTRGWREATPPPPATAAGGGQETGGRDG
jgi:hypothetical protein